jgi:hypothetical protein
MKKDYTNEQKNAHKMLLEICLAGIRENYDEIDKFLVENTIDWGEFIKQVIKHKIMPIAYFELSKCTQYEKKVPFFIREFMVENYRINRQKVEIYYKYLTELVSILENNNISYVVVKGLVFDQLLYCGQKIKIISDIDILIDSKSYEKTNSILGQHYITGTYDCLNNEIVPMTREKEIFFRVTRDHLPEHMVLTNNQVCPFVKIDVSINNDWKEKGYVLPLLSGSKNIDKFDLEFNNIKVKTLKTEYHFLYAILHLHRHAWSYRFIERNISVRLSMFMDIAILWLKNKKELQEKFVKLLVDEAMLEKVSWVLYYTDRLWNLDIIASLNLTVNRNALNKAYSRSGSYMSWNGGIEQRLWSDNERLLFEEETKDGSIL